MTEEEMIKRCPDIVKVTPQIMNEVSIKIMGQELDFNKTLVENGWDDLDGVEMIMELEKKLNIVIFDDVADAFTGGKPPQFVQYNRNKKIEELGL
jgi:acyl carrier protein